MSEGYGTRCRSERDVGDVVEVSFNSAVSRPRPPTQLSGQPPSTISDDEWQREHPRIICVNTSTAFPGGEQTVFALSVLLAPTILTPPRILLLDEVDAALDYSAQSRLASM